MNRIQAVFTTAIALSLGSLFLPGQAQAAYPSREIFDLAVQRYSLKLDSDRSGCANYANPNTLQTLDDYRVLFVIRMTDRDSPGSLCNGVFETKGVRVKCATEEVSYGGLPVRPEEEWRRDAKVAQKVCAVRSPQPLASLDTAFFDRVRQSYTLFLERGSFEQRQGCSFYANPKTVSGRKNERYVSVLNQAGENDGTICRGVFKFFNLSVRCQTGEISYAEHLGSPATWKENWQKRPQVADRICKLPLRSPT